MLYEVITLAAGVAHEIGNPLNSLTIHLQLIQRRITSYNVCYTKLLRFIQSQVIRQKNFAEVSLKSFRIDPKLDLGIIL